MMIEVYEEAALDDAKRASTDLNRQLHDRRQAAASGDAAHRDPFPTVHQHTFQAAGDVHIINPSTCATGSPATAVVHVE
jgi:hypothetical protein